MLEKEIEEMEVTNSEMINECGECGEQVHHDNEEKVFEGENGRDRPVIESEDRDIKDEYDEDESEDENEDEDEDDDSNEEQDSDEDGESYSENGDLDEDFVV